MASPKYLNFDLQITIGTNGYRARLLDSPAGQAAVDFQLPFNDEETGAFVEQLLQSSNRQSSLFEKGMLRTFGGQLFDALFHGELLVALGRSLDEAQRQGAGLRIRLRLSDTPKLVNLPWEYLYHATANRFLTLSTASPLVHFLELPQPLRPFTVTPPVCILGLIASPSDLPPLNVEQEWSNLQNALGDLIASSQVELVRLENPTLAELQQTLRQRETHVLHFIGHGVFDLGSGDGLLAFCNPDGAAEMVSSQQLGQLLHNEQSLRLVVLNACEGSRTSIDDPFAGTAQTLVQQGVPAVIAMQFVISDPAAITFSQEFYAALADGYAVDAALTEARVAISTRHRGGEWGTPKLFLRAADGVLWQVGATTGAGKATPRQNGESIDQDLGALTNLMQSVAVRNRVAAFRANFQAAAQQIDLLIHYKELHDLLHRLQFRCYNVIRQEETRFPSDDLALDNLLNYEVTLQDIVGELHALSRRAAIPGGELAWIEEVVQARIALHEAITKLDATALKRSIWLLKRVIALQPSNVCQRLNAAARALRLATLVEAMSAIHAALGGLKQLDRDTLAQFEIGVASLRSLDERLAGLVDAHDRWQATERMLNRIDDVMAHDPSELEFSWPDVQTRMGVLCQGNQEEWVQLLTEDGVSLTGALTARNPALIQRYFRRYRQRAGNRFYQVDVMLKNVCEELRKVGEPLTSVLQILE